MKSFAFRCVYLAAIAGTGFYVCQSYLDHQVRLHTLETQQANVISYYEKGLSFIKLRQWQQAEEQFKLLHDTDPHSPCFQIGTKFLHHQHEAFRNQSIHKWSQLAEAELAACKFSQAEDAVHRLIDEVGTCPQAESLMAQITAARKQQALENSLLTAKKLAVDKKWQHSIDVAQKILQEYPNHPEALEFVKEGKENLERIRLNQLQAKEIFAQCQNQDKGVYDRALIEKLRAAALLDPSNQEINQLLNKISNYIKTYKVPGDFDQLSDAVTAAHAHDRIVLGEGVWKAPILVKEPISIEGSDPEKCIVEGPSTEANVLTLTPSAKGCYVSGIQFRHQAGASEGPDRFSVGLIQANDVKITNCTFANSGGHGLVISNDSQVTIDRCRFIGNHWNGLSIHGKKASAKVTQSLFYENFLHGIEVWQDASADLSHNRCQDNTKNGIHIDSLSDAITVTHNVLTGNHEYGAVISSCGKGKCSNNTAQKNSLGGFVILAKAAPLMFSENQTSANGGPGLATEQGIAPDHLLNNSFTDSPTGHLPNLSFPRPKNP